jgi:WD40 repeat protein
MKSPFKFLDIYTREDRDIFFGREREIDELYHRIFESKILLVYGLSGTGKSSLIQCGLSNRFPETDWFPINVRRGTNIIESLSKAIQKAAITPLNAEPLTSHNFVKKVKSLFLDYYKPIYFVFDQFEELFIFGNSEEKNAFINLIKDVAESELQCRFIFVLREEYLGGITVFEKTIPGFLNNRVRIERMTYVNAKRAIEGPCNLFNIPVEKGFAETLLKKLSINDSEIELTYLQVFLDKLYRKAQEHKSGLSGFRLSLLSETENVSDILGSFLDEQIKKFPQPDDALVILKSFVSLKGTRRQMDIGEVGFFTKTLGQLIENDTLRNLIQKLVQLRILREKDQNNRYELIHDALAAIIFEKISLVEKDLIELRYFVENAHVIFEKRGKLLTEDDLKYIAPYENKLFLSQNINEFIGLSKKTVYKRKKRVRNYFMSAIIALIIILSGLTIWALEEKNNANELYIQSMATTYNYLSNEVVASNPNAALLLAEYAHQLDTDNPDIYNNIRRIYYNNSFYTAKKPFGTDMKLSAISKSADKFILTKNNSFYLMDSDGNEIQRFTGHTQPIISLTFSPDESMILSGSYDRTARLWNIDGQQLQLLRGHRGEVGEVAFSKDGQFILTSSWDKEARIWDLQGNNLKILTNHYLVSFSQDGKTLFGFSEKSFYTCDLDGMNLRNFTGHDDRITSFDISPSGNYLLTGSVDMTARLWDINGDLLQIYKGHKDVISHVGFLADENNIITCSKGNASVWHTNGLIQRSFKIQQEIIMIAFTDLSEMIIAGTVDGNLFYLHNSGNLKHVLDANKGATRFIAFSNEDKLLLQGTPSDAVVWDSNGSMIIRYADFADFGKINILHGCFAQRDKIVLLCDDNSLSVWDLSGRQLIQFNTPPATTVFASSDGKLFLIGALDNVAYLYDNAGFLIQTFSGHLGNVISLAISEDKKKILTGSMDNTARLWEINGSPLTVLKGHTSPVTAVAFGPDQSIYTGSAFRTEVFIIDRGRPWLLHPHTGNDNSIRIWDESGNQKKIFQNNQEKISSISFSVDEGTILLGFENHTAKFFDQFGQEMQTLKGHRGLVNAVAISPNGKLLASADNSLFVWNSMESYEQFDQNYTLGNLSIEERIEFGIFKFKDILRLDREEEIRKAADYYYIASSIMHHQKAINYLQNSADLYQKLVKNNKQLYDMSRILEAYHKLNEISPSKTYIKKIDNFSSSFLQSDKPEMLKAMGQFFSQKASQSLQLVIREDYLYKAKLFYDKLQIDFPEIDISEEVVSIYIESALTALANGKKREAVDFAKQGASKKPDIDAQACLVICCFLNDQENEVSDIINYYKTGEINRNRFERETKKLLDKVSSLGLDPGQINLVIKKLKNV